MMKKYTNLDRRFVDVDVKNYETAIQRALIDEAPFGRSLHWPELLEAERVVILAEAGSGKTLEMEEQAKALRENGKAAFFIPLQALHADGLQGCIAMNSADLARFEGWIAADGELAWLFLDSVDELKLTTATLDRALGCVARDVSHAMARLRVVVSCRPWDWRPVDDRQTLLCRLPTSDPVVEPLPTGEDGFLAPVRERKLEKEEPKQSPKVRIVVMAPLSRGQIKTFLEANAKGDPGTLLEEIVRQDALPFARRPLDLKRLITSWDKRGSLGSHLQQHEDDVDNALIDRTNRPDAMILSREEVVDGVERLALAMMLTKTRALQDIDSEADIENVDTVLSPADILCDWPGAKISALLRRAIFDPATYGRVQFHHRSVLEFLAARRIHKLRQTNLSQREMTRLLFADTYGERILIPAMRPVTAWLSIWRRDVAEEVLKREPEVLVQFGDPGSLSVEIRRNLLRAFVSAYGGGGWRGLQMPTAETRRLAQSDLSDEIISCWSKATNEEAQDFLIQLVWLGAIKACVSIAFEAAQNTDLQPATRTFSIRALNACGCLSDIRAIAEDMLANPSRWPHRTVFYSAADLFPNCISVPEFMALVRRTPEPKSTTGGFGWAMREIVEALKPLSAEAVALRDELADEILSGFTPTRDRHSLKSSKAYLTMALTILCGRQLDAGAEEERLVRAAVIANRLRGRDSDFHDERAGVRIIIRERTALRRMAAMIELEIAAHFGGAKSGWDMYYLTWLHESLPGEFKVEDWDWLIEQCEAYTGIKRAAILVALAQIWWLRGSDARDRSLLLEMAKGDDELVELLQRRTDTTPSKDGDDWDREERKYKRQRDVEQAKIEESWRSWQRKADGDPEAMFSEKERRGSINSLVQWLGFSPHGSGLARENWLEVRRVLGSRMGDLFEGAMRAEWRKLNPPLRSNRRIDHNLIYRSQTTGLTGLLIEAASDPRWAAKLDVKEAKRAAEWATVDINNLPEWTAGLAEYHPQIVRKILAKEIAAELGEAASVQHPHVLSAIQYGVASVAALVAPDVVKQIEEWPDQPADEDRQHFYAENIDRALTVLVAADALSKEIGAVCCRRFLADLTSPSAVMWLGGAFKYSLELGLSALENGLKATKKSKRAKICEVWLAALFGDRHARRSIPVRGDVSHITKLVRIAYQQIAIADDIRHEGVFSPGVRDDAQSARNVLISALLDLPGKLAHRALLTLADDPLFAHMPDRLRLLARERAAADSELAPMTAATFRSWEQQYETPPATPDDLFRIMMDRLDDIEQDVRHHPFSDRHILKPIQAETAMQPLLAKKVEDAGRNVYQVTREEEVADKKETDIRLLAGAAGKAVIEIKIGDRYSVRQLEAAICQQLKDKYLRHPDCRVGCLLITYAGLSNFQNPATRKRMNFEDVVTHLRAYASELEAADDRDIRMGVATLDLRDQKFG